MLDITKKLLFQCFHRTSPCAVVAQNAFGSVLSLARVVAHLNLHRTHFHAFATFDALAFIAADAKARVVAHWFEKSRNRTDILAKGAVVLEEKSQRDAYYIIYYIARYEEREQGGGIDLV